MKHQESSFQGKRNLRIYRQTWLPVRPRATVVLVHGLGEHSGRYAHVAELLVAADCAVYALDHRGHGKSEGRRALIDRFANAVEDIDQVVDIARREQRGKPLFLVGHSMGGALALSYTLKYSAKLSGLILSGPAVVLDGAPVLMKLVARLLSVVAPGLGVFKVDPVLVSRDAGTVADYVGDPLNAHGKTPARTLGEIIKFVDWLPAALPVLRLPVLAMHGSEDKLAGVSGSRMVIEAIGSKDKTLKIYEGLYHEIFNELPADRQHVLDDLKSWITARIPAAVS